jgi:CubicO group peptidase (beta-lactamase class C family)
MPTSTDDPSIEAQGYVDPGFEPVRDAFVNNFNDGEVGASFSVWRGNRAVVDLWAGHADRARTRPWRRDSLANVWSTTKGITATCCAMLVDRGELDYAQRVAHYWPEFGGHGRQDVTVAMLLSHQAGLSGPREPVAWLDFCDSEKILALLLDQEPLFEPGTGSGYHAVTFGTLVGELVRRATGESLGSFLQREVAEPLAADFFIGLPECHEPRVAEMIGHDGPTGLVDWANDVQRYALGNPPGNPEIPNERAWRAAELPAVNGQATAIGIAKIYGALANGGETDGVRLLGSDTLERATSKQIAGVDLVFNLPFEWGCGFIRNVHKILYGPNPEAFGHTGYGGAYGYADPARGIGVGYTMNRMGASLIGDQRGNRLVAALDACFD